MSDGTNVVFNANGTGLFSYSRFYFAIGGYYYYINAYAVDSAGNKSNTLSASIAVYTCSNSCYSDSQCPSGEFCYYGTCRYYIL
ncbi:MAG: hypothetical protein HQK89_02430 [Nitrospirae bacterium]|nr:hypothetical protein [Nitrospirota bacterium]